MRISDAPFFQDSPWQMSLCERVAVEGLASQLQPRLAIEIGTAEGCSLAALARHSDETHSFDLVPPPAGIIDTPGVTLHTGDSHSLLPKALASFTAAARNVDFVLVDGDHSADGVRKDVEDLLASAAVSDTVILVHDLANATVREGLHAVRLDGYPKVRYVDLDFLTGYVLRGGLSAGEMWGGLGLIVVDARHKMYVEAKSPFDDARYSGFELLLEGWQRKRDQEQSLSGVEGLAAPGGRTVPALERELARVAGELESSRAELAHAYGLSHEYRASLSWRITAPLRALRHLPERLLRRPPPR